MSKSETYVKCLELTSYDPLRSICKIKEQITNKISNRNSKSLGFGSILENINRQINFLTGMDIHLKK